MEKAKSVQFRVISWQHNHKASRSKLMTRADFFCYALRDSDNPAAGVVGFAFRWVLSIYSNELEVIHFSCEEMFEVNDKNMTMEEVKNTVKRSYVMAYGEAADRNVRVGITSSFPKLDDMKINYSEVAEILKL